MLAVTGRSSGKITIAPWLVSKEKQTSDYECTH